MKLLTTLSSVIALSTALSVPSYTASAAEDFVIEDIIVTAQKRSERLKDVPISMSALSADQLDQTGMRDLKSIAEYIPNLQISQGNDFRSKVTIRGVGASSRNIGFDARVGVYVDGVYMGQSPSLNQELLDMERVEVLRGPQGTLFGKNTVAGAINLITKKPNEEFSGQASADFGNLKYREFKGRVNIPLSDKVFAKFSVSKADRDGYVDNITTGNKLMEVDTVAYRAQFRFLISDQLEVNASFDGLNAEANVLIGEPLTDMLGMVTVPLAPEERVVAFSFDPRDKRDVYGGHVDVEYETDGGFTIKSITGYRETDAFYTNVTDYSHLDIVSIEYADKYKQFSEEVQFISPNDQDFTYMVGLYYYNQKSDTNRDVIFGDDFHEGFIGPLYGSGALPLPPGMPLSLVSQLIGFGPEGSKVFNSGTVTTTSYAAYFNGSYEISDKLKLGVGFRYSIEDKDVNWLLDGRNSGVFFIGSTGVDPEGPVIEPTPLVNDRQDKFFAPAVSLTYAVSDDANVYAKYSSGYKSGGFNLDYINENELAKNKGLEFDKETVKSFEIGYKASFFDNRISLNMAGFVANYDDYQVNQFVDLGGGRTSIRITNAAKVKTKGIEAESTWHVTDGLTFTGSVGILDAIFDEFFGGGTAGSDASGNRLPYATTFNAAFSAQYYHDIEALDATLLVRADITHRSDYFTTVNNDSAAALRLGGTVPFDHIEALTMVNGRIGLISNDESWEVYLWGRNLTNQKQYTDDLRDFFGTISRFPNLPRTYGLEAVFNF